MSNWPAPGSFSERIVLQGGVRRTADLAAEVDRLAPEHLEYILASIIAGRLRAGREIDDTFLTVALSIALLEFFMGLEWTNENVHRPHKDFPASRREARRFLRTDHGDVDSRFMWQDRTCNLAWLLYNLQGVEGIASRIETMRTCDLESAVGELECVRLFAVPERKLRFITPVGKKGADYEAEFTTTTGRVVCCEIKTKKEETELTRETIWNTCEGARRQLPKGRPGVVFLKIPEEWTTQTEARSIIEFGVHKAFRQSHRLVGVVLKWEQWAHLGSWRAVVRKFQPLYNYRSSNFGQDIEDCFSHPFQTSTPHWLSITHFVEERMQQLTSDVLAYLGRGSGG